jgi:hypothetical protein
MAQDLGGQHCTARRSNRYPVYSVPGADLRWVDVSPQCHDALFLQANLRSGGKLRAISRLIKTWGVAVAPGVILANSSIEARERLRDSVKAAADQAQAALDAQTRGENASARRHWKALFKKRGL